MDNRIRSVHSILPHTKEVFVEVIETYLEAVKTVSPKMQVGRLSSIWISFAKFYEKNKHVADVCFLLFIFPYIVFVHIATM